MSVAAYTVIEQAAMAQERQVCVGLVEAVIQKYCKRLGELPIDSPERLTYAHKTDVLLEAKRAITEH